MRFHPRQGEVEILSVELGKGWQAYESKRPLDNGSVAVKHAQMKCDAYAALLRDLAVVGSAELKPIPIKAGKGERICLSTLDFWVFARLTASGKTLFDLDWAGYEGDLHEAEYARPQAAVGLVREAVEGLDFTDGSGKGCAARQQWPAELVIGTGPRMRPGPPPHHLAWRSHQPQLPGVLKWKGHGPRGRERGRKRASRGRANPAVAVHAAEALQMVRFRLPRWFQLLHRGYGGFGIDGAGLESLSCEGVWFERRRSGAPWLGTDDRRQRRIAGVQCHRHTLNFQTWEPV